MHENWFANVLLGLTLLYISPKPGSGFCNSAWVITGPCLVYLYHLHKRLLFNTYLPARLNARSGLMPGKPDRGHWGYGTDWDNVDDEMPPATTWHCRVSSGLLRLRR